jgi:hypothetical protein
MCHAPRDNNRVKTVRRTSDLPIDAEVVRQLILKPATFAFVSAPLLRLTGDMPRTWEVGNRVALRLWLCGVIPMNRHVIEIVDADPEAGWARTLEHGGAVSHWQHTLRVESTGPGTCRYSDEIELEAGLLTPIVAAIARGFYVWRHRRWRELARVLA